MKGRKNSLLLIGCVVEDFVRIQVPVFEGSFDQARHDHKHQHQDVNTGEHLIDHSRLFHPKRQQSCKTNTTIICCLPEHTQTEAY